jgi:hypothetical protein
MLPMLEAIHSNEMHCFSIEHVIRHRGHIDCLIDEGKIEEGGNKKEVLGSLLPEKVVNLQFCCNQGCRSFYRMTQEVLNF